MKKLAIIFSFALASTTLSAQNQTTKKADKLFGQYQYVAATEEYLKLVDKNKSDNYLNKQLATSYYNMRNTLEASKWYAEVVKKPQDAETYYRYAQMLKANGNYDQANKQMLQFAALLPNDSRAMEFNKNPNYMPTLLQIQKWYDVKIADFNSDQSDFAAIINNKKIYFTSSRNTSSKKDGWNKEPFLDVYRADYNPAGATLNIQPVSDLNTSFHDGPVSITADGKTMYFSSSSFRKSSYDKDKKNNIKIGRNTLFTATKEGEKWTSITALPFNNVSFSMSNPSISADGKILYFSSDMPGGFGDTDIWKVVKNNDGTFGKPENLGPNVNTAGKETFPFINEEEAVLYFASNARTGFGGLDVFQINLNENTPATNLGKPVNSEKDDFALTYNKEQDSGFLSSNRNGKDNIYVAIPVCALQVITTVTNAANSQIVTNAEVVILDGAKNKIASETTNLNGEVRFRVDCNKPYAIQVTKEGFEGAVYAVDAKAKKEAKITANLQPIASIVKENEVVLQPILFEFDKSNITEQAAFELEKLVQVMKLNPKMQIQIKSHTDTKGEEAYNLNLSEQRAQATVQYLVSRGIVAARLTAKGLGESEPKVNCQENCTPEQDASNRRAEFLIVK